HLQYRTHYTYSDTAVAGFLPDVITVDIEKEIGETATSFQTIEQLRSYCFQNIQDIDLDLYYATPDLRSFRLQLDCSSTRSIDRCLSILKKYPQLRHSQLNEIITTESELPGRLPSYLQIEITTQSTVRPTIYPSVEAAQDRTLSNQMIDKIIDDLSLFDLENDLTISFAGRGDPFEFAGLENFVNRLLNLSCTKAIYIESPAVQVTRTQIESLLNLNQVTFIIQLPTLNRAKYTKWMGAERLTDVLAFIDSIISKPVNASVYVEMIRLPDNEDELDEFMNRFSPDKTGGNITPIIGKYSRYGETLPKLDVVDLSPLVRDYCRHLAYDLFINADGCVPICRQHLNGGISVLESDLSSIFKSRRQLYLYSVNNQYQQISPVCANCDDWYIFNA
ncbi:MAG: spiro-SPASM protein, partial [Leptonema sp. (in: Bacteria)]|nr:spiro-SPASM protein [Leptonema sp. (in: bacteria)]